MNRKKIKNRSNFTFIQRNSIQKLHTIEYNLFLDTYRNAYISKVKIEKAYDKYNDLGRCREKWEAMKEEEK